MTPAEIIQAKVIAIQSVGPGGNIQMIKERFEFLVEDSVDELVKKELLASIKLEDIK